MDSAGAAGGSGRAAGSAGVADVDGRAGFEAVFLDPVGQEVRQRWEDACVAVAFENLAPVSAFPVVPGRRWGPGLWWSATTGRHVASGSNAMRAQLMVLDRDPQVTGLAGRPVRLLWRTRRGQPRSWVPQLFARYADGTALLADCPGHADAGGERALRGEQAARTACDLVGWRYRRLEPLDAVFAANLRWLAGYRHPRFRGRPEVADALLEAFARPRPLLKGVQAVGTPMTVLPAVFHALWHGQLAVSLERPLHQGVLVGPGSVRAMAGSGGMGTARVAGGCGGGGV
ncbi:TnsA-like heteromeric transposase endonuclease subunit [Kitasatospora purpeofusca]|uniref:TnsA-like heteromeric transposase endonuclease subunit n=1 Tax=Kitasatospora purpeofusca TaxID=67352 RepID=UPI0036E62D2B